MYIERTNYYAKPGHRDAVLRTRREASEVRRTLGLPSGTIHVKSDPATDGPDVLWECPFPTAETMPPTWPSGPRVPSSRLSGNA